MIEFFQTAKINRHPFIVGNFENICRNNGIKPGNGVLIFNSDRKILYRGDPFPDDFPELYLKIAAEIK